MKYSVKYRVKYWKVRCIGNALDGYVYARTHSAPIPHYRPTDRHGMPKKLAFAATWIVSQRRLRHRIKRAADHVAVGHHTDQALRAAPVHGAP